MTSYKELYRDANDCERWNMLHPGESPKIPFVTADSERRSGTVRRGIRLYEGAAGIFGEVGSADNWCRSGPTVLAAAKTAPLCATSSKWMRSISCSLTLGALAREKKISVDLVKQAVQDLGIDRGKTESGVELERSRREKWTLRIRIQGMDQ